MPASPFLFENSRARARRGARIAGGAAVAPCGTRGGPGAAQARLPSHAVALHPPRCTPVCVRCAKFHAVMGLSGGGERGPRSVLPRRARARAWGAQPPALSGSDVAPAAQPDCRGAALMRALCAGFFRRPRRGRRAARTRPRVVRCGGREAPAKGTPADECGSGKPAQGAMQRICAAAARAAAQLS
jgi:hypothetical protein